MQYGSTNQSIDDDLSGNISEKDMDENYEKKVFTTQTNNEINSKHKYIRQSQKNQ
jgi:hypothetical protein